MQIPRDWFTWKISTGHVGIVPPDAGSPHDPAPPDTIPLQQTPRASAQSHVPLLIGLNSAPSAFGASTTAPSRIINSVLKQSCSEKERRKLSNVMRYLAGKRSRTGPGAVWPTAMGVWPGRFSGSLLALLATVLSPFAAAGSTPSDSALYERAFALAQLGREAASAELLQRLVSAPDASLARRARMLLMSDERALFDYRAALRAVEPLLKSPDAELANRVRLLRFLIDVPPETAERPAAIWLRSPLVGAKVGRKELHLLIDTGASLSVLSRSAAIQAGLRIRPVNYEIESALGRKLHADVAVGDITIAGMRIHNVVFLVLPDGTLQHDLPCPGVMGLPVLRVTGPLIFPGIPKSHTQEDAPLTLVQGNAAAEITLHGRRLTCLLDTGSNRSWITASSGPDHRDLQGLRRSLVIRNAAGAARQLPAYEGSLEFSLAGRPAVLSRVLVMARGEHGENGMSCTLGADAIVALAPVSLDFSQMRIMLW